MNKREYPRIAASRIVLRVSSPERLRNLYLRDLSLGGLFVKSDKRFPLGTPLTVELWPPEWKEALVFEATVIRWQEQAGDNPQGMGMKFGDLTADVRDRLAKLIEEYGKLVPEQEEFVEKGVIGLIGDLETARRHIVELEKQLTKERAERAELEQDEADVRKLADKLATEKSAFERKTEDELTAAAKLLEDAIADRQRLMQEIERLKTEQLRAQELAKNDANTAATTAEDLRRLLSEQSAEAALHRQRADLLADEVEKRRAKERDLRKLLAAIGAGAAAGETKAAGKPGADESSDSLTIEEGTAAPPPSATKPPPPPKDDKDDAKDDAKDNAEPAKGSEGWEENIDIATMEADEDFTAFQQRLKNGTRLMPADKLRSRKPKGDHEKLVMDLLQAGPTFQTLVNQVGSKVPEATLHRLLFELNTAELLELRG
jgi:Tfp pilus assembly protein PilZ